MATCRTCGRALGQHLPFGHRATSFVATQDILREARHDADQQNDAEEETHDADQQKRRRLLHAVAEGPARYNEAGTSTLPSQMLVVT